jgi:hypothetical protein
VSGLGVLALGVQFRRPATLLPYRGVLRVGARNRAGPLGSGGRTFSSGTSLASPSVRSSFVLRDVRHSKSQICNDSNTERGPQSATEECGHRWRGRVVVCRGVSELGRRRICQNRGWSTTDRSITSGKVRSLTIREVGVCSLRISISDVGVAAEWRPAERRRHGRTATPTKVAAFAS